MKKYSLFTLLMMPIATLLFAGESTSTDYLKNTLVFHYGPGPSYYESPESVDEDLNEDSEEQKVENTHKQDRREKESPSLSFK
jgi:hypothetical protein